MDYIDGFRVLGVTYIAVGLGILFNLSYYRKMLDEYEHSYALGFVNGFLALIAGYFLLFLESSWQWGLPLAVTVIGWLAVLKGVIILVLPRVYLATIRLVKMRFLPVEAAFAVILGIVLAYLGFCY